MAEYEAGGRSQGDRGDQMKTIPTDTDWRKSPYSMGNGNCVETKRMPKRIQRKRTKGWTMPKDAVYVGRPTRWGNPYRWSDYQDVGHDYDGEPYAVSVDARRRFAVTDFMSVVKLGIGARAFDYPSKDEIRRALAGKDLVCWCPEGSPCHADVLLELANEEATDG